MDFEPLTATYERLRHSTDPAELSEFARRPLPDRADQAAFSRATALLEAVAGNPHTPVADRVFLADTMPFPNVLVKLSEDPEPSVRQAVAANGDDKNWLVGRLTRPGNAELKVLDRLAEDLHAAEAALERITGEGQDREATMHERLAISTSELTTARSALQEASEEIEELRAYIETHIAKPQ